MFGLWISTLISIIAGVVLSAMPARATTVAYSSGFATPGRTLDFSGLVDNTLVGNDYAGVTFTGLYVNSSQGNTLPPTTAPAAVNYNNNVTNSPFSFTFASAQSDVVFFLYTDGYGATVTSSLNGVNVESVSAAGFNTAGKDFFGFTNSSFDTITVNVTGTGGPNTGLALIDNVEIGQLASQVSEPASAAILLAGFLGVLTLRGRRRA